MEQTFNRKVKCPKEEKYWLLFIEDLQAVSGSASLGLLSCKQLTFLGIKFLLLTFS